MMKAYVQFLEINLAHEMSESMGSDGVFILDGRNNMDTWLQDADHQFKRMTKHVRPYYVGYDIMKGSRFDNSRQVRRILKLDPEKVKVYQITLFGYDSSTDKTDHLIKWVATDHEFKLDGIIKKHNWSILAVEMTDLHPNVAGVDYFLI